ncbi:MAG: hypothetical protein CVU18_15200 [Betaproteobacteria bacterium HGW-Betaproteobacteria-12]|jgi:hypothetical protein|nr:MAG: hypothetical protein CVU18_15200 [Betaproteobacteria bacterium HGW-Betaproteobacteria-12]
MPDKPAAPKVAEAKADKTAVTPHYRVQENSGMLQMLAQPKADKPTATKEQDKHYHPRDVR